MTTDMTVRCGNCGKEFGLTPEYVAQYGGQTTQCQCGASIVIPRALAGALSSPPPLPVGYSSAESGVIAYATPAPYQQQAMASQGVWRDNNLLVCITNITLPNHCCVKCDRPADGKPMQKKFSWHHPLLFLIILAGVLIYVIVAMVASKRATLVMPFCRVHRRRRANFIATSLVLLALGIGGIVGAIAMNEGWPAAVGGVALLASLIVGVVGTQTLQPTKIDQSYAHFKGASQAYLAGLPSV